MRAQDGPRVLHALTGETIRSHILMSENERWLEPGKADLHAVQELDFQAGRVSQVFISVSPSVLYGEPGAQAEVQVRLLDRGGRTVSGERFGLSANQGLVEKPRALADGSYVAVYRPPSGFVSGEVLLSAEGGGGQFGASTTVQVIPRPQSLGLGLTGGYLQGVGGVAGGVVSLDIESKVDGWRDFLHLRGGLMMWRDRAQVEDLSRGGVIDIGLVNYGLLLQVLARRELGRRASWIGVGGIVAPYSQTVRFGDSGTIRGRGVHGPGFLLSAGAATRALAGELSLELRWVGLSGQAGELGYDGSVGGIAALVGYRVIL